MVRLKHTKTNKIRTVNIDHLKLATANHIPKLELPIGNPNNNSRKNVSQQRKYIHAPSRKKLKIPKIEKHLPIIPIPLNLPKLSLPPLQLIPNVIPRPNRPYIPKPNIIHAPKPDMINKHPSQILELSDLPTCINGCGKPIDPRPCDKHGGPRKACSHKCYYD